MCLRIISLYPFIIPIILASVFSFFPFRVLINSSFHTVLLVIPLQRCAISSAHSSYAQIDYSHLALLFYKCVSDDNLHPSNHFQILFLPLNICILPHSSTLAFTILNWVLFCCFLLIFLSAWCNTDVGCVFQSHFRCECTCSFLFSRN